jgi:predicted nucleic acid-binding protein
VDTGPLWATFDRADHDHATCVQLLAQARGVRIVPAPVLVEFDHLAARGTDRGAVDALLDEIEQGTYVVEELLGSDYRRVRELLDTYADLRVGFVDAAVLAIVERLRETKLATLDHRHFSVMRPRHVDALELLPQLRSNTVVGASISSV